MACFLVPAAEAVVTAIVKKKSDKKKTECAEKNIFISNLNLLSNMLWGGSALLAFEHIWHGEIVPWFPFLSGASSAAAAREMIFEMSTAGTAMAALVTSVWACMVMILNNFRKNACEASETVKTEKL